MSLYQSEAETELKKEKLKSHLKSLRLGFHVRSGWGPSPVSRFFLKFKYK